MHINNKHTNPTIKHNYQTKTKLGPQSPQRSRHSVARVWRRDESSTIRIESIGLLGKYGETSNSCLLSVKVMGVST